MGNLGQQKENINFLYSTEQRKMTGILYISGIIVGISITSCICEVHAQSLPLVKPSLTSGKTITLPLQTGNPSFDMEIPYLEELRKIQSIKQSYDTIRTQIKAAVAEYKDSPKMDSSLVSAKIKSKKVLDREKQTLEQMLEKNDISDEELKRAIGNTVDGVDRAEESLELATDMAGVESVIDTSEENLKALTNEWVMPKIEQHLSGTIEKGWDPSAGKVPDYFGTDALSILEKEGNSSENILLQSKRIATGRIRHIPDDYLRNIDSNFSRITIDSVGELQVSDMKDNIPKSTFFEKNSLASRTFIERTGAYILYDPLLPFGEGINIAAGISYSFSQQIAIFGGGIFRRHFSGESWPNRKGNGVSLGFRISKNNWFLQGNIHTSKATILYPLNNGAKNYTGHVLSSMAGVGRTLPIGPKVKSIMFAGVDPLYKKAKSLMGSAVQVRIGFELNKISN